MLVLRVSNLRDQLFIVERALRCGARTRAALSPLRDTDSSSHIIVVE
jgi:hypothetical protein